MHPAHRLTLLDLEIATVRTVRASEDLDLAQAALERERELTREREALAAQLEPAVATG